MIHYKNFWKCHNVPKVQQLKKLFKSWIVVWGKVKIDRGDECNQSALYSYVEILQ
jgi:hypothetical protein